MLTNWKYALAALATAAFNGVPAHAASVTYAFSGVIDQASLFAASNSAWTFEPGQKFRGQLIYDASIVTNSYDYINQPDFKLTAHYSPVVSFSYEIDTPTGTFSYSPPVAGSYVGVGVSDGSGTWWTGADLRWQNYPLGGVPSEAVPASGYIGSWYPHSSFVTLTDYSVRPLTSTDADLDLAALFNALPAGSPQFSVRFSDPAEWEPGIEHIDGILYGRITSFAPLASAVPEPSSWMLMILGFGATGFGIRRKRAAERTALA